MRVDRRNAEMADPVSGLPLLGFKTKPAVTRKHLKRDQAAARKARGAANVGDSLKDRQVLLQERSIARTRWVE